MRSVLCVKCQRTCRQPLGTLNFQLYLTAPPTSPACHSVSSFIAFLRVDVATYLRYVHEQRGHFKTCTTDMYIIYCARMDNQFRTHTYAINLHA